MNAKTAVWLGRACGVLAIVALVGARVAQLTSGAILGMSQQHLFSDATVLALLAIVWLVDSLVHAKGL